MRTESFPLVPALLAADTYWGINTNYLIEMWDLGVAYVLETHRKVRRQYVWQNGEEGAASVVLPRCQSWPWTLRGEKITVLVVKDCVTFFFSWGTEILLASCGVGMYQSVWSLSAVLTLKLRHLITEGLETFTVMWNTVHGKIKFRHLTFGSSELMVAALTLIFLCVACKLISEGALGPGLWTAEPQILPSCPSSGDQGCWGSNAHEIQRPQLPQNFRKPTVKGFFRKKYHNNAIPRLEDLGKWFMT